ncbi:UNVERIFIED_CONTAM: hypothetical protein RMT77_006395 [Armadillidium vulgare]
MDTRKTIRLSAFENARKYLVEIYKNVQNEEEVFSAHQIDGEIKYGNVSVQDNKLIFNSLSLSQAPRDSRLIFFDDLKECVGSKNFQTFIKISYNETMVGRMLCFEMMDKQLSSQFIKLCTGERGPCYKNSSFKMDFPSENSHDFLVVESNLENMNQLGEYNLCDLEMNCKFDSNANDMFLVVKSNGNFLINRTINSCERDILYHGRVVYPNLCDYLNSKNTSFMKILECGILFIL